MNKQDEASFNVGDQVRYIVTGTITDIEDGYATLKDLKVNGVTSNYALFGGEVDWVKVTHLQKREREA